MTEYLKKWRDKGTGNPRAVLCILVYILIMAGMIGSLRMQSKGMADHIAWAVFIVSLVAMGVISYPLIWGKDRGEGERLEEGKMEKQKEQKEQNKQNEQDKQNKQDNQNEQKEDRREALYRRLGEFTDTVLFEYRYRDGSILFTPNASNQMETSVLKSALEKYVECPPLQGESRCFEFRMKADTEDYRWCICHIRAEYDGGKESVDKYAEAERPVCLIGKLDDISKQKEREEQLLFQSTRDGLTGIYNKTAFEYMMEETLKRGSRGSLYMIDIDNFKDVNDQYGHPAGDRILVKTGELLREIFRDSDLIGRVGGDEFVVYSESGDTKMKALRLLNGTADFSKEGELRISVSIGIASSTGNPDEEYQELFSRADQAMYRAKQEGKNRIAWYEE